MVSEVIQSWWPEVTLKGCEEVKCTGALNGLSQVICPVCGAHLSTSGVCLNACHLGPGLQQKFHQMLASTSELDPEQQHPLGIGFYGAAWEC